MTVGSGRMLCSDGSQAPRYGAKARLPPPATRLAVGRFSPKPRAFATLREVAVVAVGFFSPNPRAFATLPEVAVVAVGFFSPNPSSVLSAFSVFKSRCLCLVCQSAFFTFHFGPPEPPQKGDTYEACEGFHERKCFCKSATYVTWDPSKTDAAGAKRYQVPIKNSKKGSKRIKFRLAHLNILAHHPLWR